MSSPRAVPWTPTGRGRMPDAKVAIHFVLTIILAGIGLVLILPGDTFATNPGYHHMALVGSETAWAMAFWACANVGFVGLFVRSLWAQLVSAFVISTMHAVFAIEIFIANPIATGTVAYSGIAGLGYYLMLRRVVDA